MDSAGWLNPYGLMVVEMWRVEISKPNRSAERIRIVQLFIECDIIQVDHEQ